MRKDESARLCLQSRSIYSTSRATMNEMFHLPLRLQSKTNDINVMVAATTNGEYINDGELEPCFFRLRCSCVFG